MNSRFGSQLPQTPGNLVWSQVIWKSFELNRQLQFGAAGSCRTPHAWRASCWSALQHIPSPGEALSHGGLQFEIVSMAGPRIARVYLVQTEEPEAPLDPHNREQGAT